MSKNVRLFENRTVFSSIMCKNGLKRVTLFVFLVLMLNVVCYYERSSFEMMSKMSGIMHNEKMTKKKPKEFFFI